MIKYICLLLSILLCSHAMAKPPAFLDNYKDATKLSEELKQEMILIFSADWCGYCKKLKKDITTNIELFEDNIICIIDIDKFPELAKNYNVKSIPKSIFFDKNNKKTREVLGYSNIEKFKNGK